MWQRLMTLYDLKSKISVSTLLQEFHSSRMTDGINVAGHIAHVESMVTRLSDLGKVIEESYVSVIEKLLQLPRCYILILLGTIWTGRRRYS